MSLLQPQPDSAFNALNGSVYEGVWIRHSESVFKRRIWTVKDSKAFLILASLAMLIAFTQTRAWVLIRYFIIQRKRPVRLHDDSNPERLQYLSQGRAVMEALSSTANAILTLRILVRRAFRTGGSEPSTHSDYSVVSPWFGIF